METNEIVQAPEHYNPNQLVTYKVISDGNVTYPTSKVVDLEWVLDNARRTDNSLSALRNSISNLEDKLAGWIEDEESAESIVSLICDIFGFNATKEVEFECIARITGHINVPLSEIASFDINDVDLSIDINSYSHDIEADAEIEPLEML